MSKNIAILSDFHCGHKAGLTPKGYLPEEPAEERARWINANKAYYNWYNHHIRKYGPYDIIFLNGDLLDGTGKKSGGTEQITTDMEEQCDMAVKIIREIPKNKKCEIVITRGTSYHVGDSEDWENIIAERVGAAIGEHEWVEVEGVVFDLKHHPAGSSGLPHGRHTGVARDRLWNIMWAERELQPKADIFIRSHVHYHNFAGGPDWLGMTTPALQGFGSRYGARRCTGLVDFGFVTFQVNKGTYTWQPIIAKLEEQKAPMIKL
jgi:hypothetical protein